MTYQFLAPAHLIERQFARMGARVKLHAATNRGSGNRVSLDVGQDGEGEFFDISARSQTLSDMTVIDCQPRTKHLFL